MSKKCNINLTEVRPGVYVGNINVETSSGEDFFEDPDRASQMQALIEKNHPKPKEIVLGKYEHGTYKGNRYSHHGVGGTNSWNKKIRDNNMLNVKFEVVLREIKE